MKKILLIFMIVCSCNYNSQLKINFEIDPISRKASILLYNDSLESVAIPIDTSSLRPYFDDICLDISEYKYPYPTLGFNLVVKKMITNELLNSASTSGMPSNKLKFKEYVRENKKKEKFFFEKVKKWQKENQIENFNFAKINYYISKNMLFLKPKERRLFKIHFDLNNITNETYKYSFYTLESAKKYIISVVLNIDECIYNNFTENQRSKLKNYKLFSGKLESNVIELKQ